MIDTRNSKINVTWNHYERDPPGGRYTDLIGSELKVVGDLGSITKKNRKKGEGR